MKTTDASRMLLYCGSCLIYGLMLQPAHAQDSAAAASVAISASTLEEIVVTAQKRKENLQETPITISAMTAELLEQRGTSDISTLTSFAPNLMVKPTPGATSSMTIVLRGMTEGDIILTGDAPIGIYVDGVVLGRQAGSVFDLVDLERIEVLRGPQGTLYGRNTTGGAVNLITAKPAEEFHAKAKASYGNWNQWQTRASIDTGQWGESGIRSKLSYVHREQNGYVDDLNAPSSRDPGAFMVDAARLALAFDRGGALHADYAFDYNERKGVPAAFQATAANATVQGLLDASAALGGNSPQLAAGRLDKMYLDHHERTSDKTLGHALTLEFKLADATLLRSLTGYRKWTQATPLLDMDGQGGIHALTVSPAILAPPYTFISEGVQQIGLFVPDLSNRKQHQVSQEFNLLGKLGDRLDYVAGVFYFKEKSYEHSPQSQTIAVGPMALPPTMPAYVAATLESMLDYTHKSDSKAVFGQATYAFTERLNFTIGMRYTEDRKDLVQAMPFARHLRRDFSRFNWSTTLDFKIRDEVMTYGRIATGYKAGGVNARSVNDGYKPEDLISYELGVKSELLDRRLRLNAAIFYVDHDDLQITQFVAGSGGASTNTVNAGKAEYQGLEVEFEALLPYNLTLSGSFGYLDRDFKEFWIVDPVTSASENISDTASNVHPKTTANAALQYDLPRLALGQLSARVEYNYRAKFYSFATTVGTPLNESIINDSRGLLDARLTLSELSLGTANASISLWGRNLTDEEYRVIGIDFGALGYAGNVYGEPRSYGVDIGIQF